MRFDKSFIPYGHYWSTPFCQWQGSLSREHSLTLVASVGQIALRGMKIDVRQIEALHLGCTVPQKKAFYGAAWVATLMGLPSVTGPTLSQACATSARTICSAASAIECGGSKIVLAITADRTSNGPQIYYPNPGGPGGQGESEAWTLDNFNDDPVLHIPMVATAENLARRHGITREHQDEAALLRYRQYQSALLNDCAFQRRYMVRPLELSDRKGSKRIVADGDEGVHTTTAHGLAQLRPQLVRGTVTFGHQTHPADGNCGMVIANPGQAQELSPSGPSIQLISYGEGRAEAGYMGEAPVPAAQRAMAFCGLTIADMAAVKTHNPFVINDIYLSRTMGLPLDKMNNYGSSLIFGHPQGPTGMRLLIELIEELSILGGGYGLFTGCAGGDSAAALVIKVE
jgi:acetyl-CoA acetyltransferase family protein